jgi:type I restriction enzyme, S subunit
MTPIARVADLAEQIRGVSYDKEDASSTPRAGYLPVLRAGNITDDGLVFDDLVFVPAERISDKQRIRRNDVVIAASSGSLDVVGKAARAPSDYEGGFGAFCKVLRPGPDVDPVYFGHFFRTPEYRRRVSALAAGISINNLRNEHLDQMSIPLPPLPEQRRIAKVLEQADSLRARRRAALAQLDTLIQAIFLEMFGDPATNPMNWPDPTLSGVLSFLQYGPRFYNESYSESGVRIVRITDLDERGSLDFTSMPRLTVSNEDREKYLLRPGDLIFARSGATVGKIALIQSDAPPCIAGAYFITMRFDSRIDPRYARAVLSCPSVRSIVATRSRQAAQQNFSGPGLRQLPMPCPPIELQQKFAHRIETISKIESVQSSSRAVLDKLFVAIQQRLFSSGLVER